MLHDAAMEYWKASQHVANLPDQSSREAYTLGILIPKRNTAPEAARRMLLSKIIDRVVA